MMYARMVMFLTNKNKKKMINCHVDDNNKATHWSCVHCPELNFDLKKFLIYGYHRDKKVL